MNTFCKRHVCEGEEFDIYSKFKRGFEKGNMFFIITFESMTILSLIPPFELELVLMFFCIDSIRELKTSI